MLNETRSRARFFLYYLVDLAFATLVDPSETLVISGFWRSGTTWLQELLAGWLDAKTIFEPFHLSVPETRQLFDAYGLAEATDSQKEIFIPYWSAADETQRGLLKLQYENALTGKTRGRAARMLRTGWRDSLRRRLVLKLTRGQRSLGAVQQQYGFPLLHVVRDPRAVIASIRMTDWDWLFDALSLAGLIRGTTDERWQAEFERYAGAEKSIRIAVYWAFLETEFSKTALTQARTACVHYEQVITDPEAALREALAGIRSPLPHNLAATGTSKASYSTSAGRRDLAVEERLFSWKRVLSSREAASIERVAERLGLADRLVDDVL